MSIPGSRSARLIRIGLVIIGITLVGLIVPPWLRATMPARQLRLASRASLVAGRALLLMAQPVYGASVVFMVAGLAVSGRRVIRARRRGESRPRAARWLLLCASGLSALVAAEAAAAVLLGRRHAHPAFRPAPIRSDVREEAALDVVVIGGSSACGLPFEKWLSTGHIVAWKLGEVIPDRQVRLKVLAQPGFHLERMHGWLAAYPHRTDLLIVYSGHNEFTGRFAWSRSPRHYRDEDPDRLVRWIKELGRRCSPICAMVQEALEAQGLGDPPPPEITRQLVDVPACTVEEYAARLADYSHRLEEIVDHCERTGTLVVILVPPSNDAGFEPNRSVLPPETSRDDREAFTQRFLAIRAIEETDPTRAIAEYRRLLEGQPGFAEAHFRLARLLERSGAADAGAHYRSARDLDGFPMRCPGDFQAACREVAARHPGAILVDGEAALAAESPGGILGDRFFLDAMHPTVRGHAILARAILVALRSRRAFGWPEATPCPRVEPAECAAHFGVGPEAWEVACEWGVTFYERTAHIRYDPSTRLAWIERYRQAARAIAAGDAPEDVGLPGIGVRSEPPPSGYLRAAIETGRASGR